jgi:hypothetical protein
MRIAAARFGISVSSPSAIVFAPKDRDTHHSEYPDTIRGIFQHLHRQVLAFAGHAECARERQRSW